MDTLFHFAALVYEALHDHACVGYFDEVQEPNQDCTLRVKKDGAEYTVTIERVR